MKRRQRDFDRLLIDWADEFIQDLVASFSSRRPTMAVRLIVAGLYLNGALHLLWVLVLPFYRHAVAALIGDPSLGSAPLNAFATSIIIGRMSYHLLIVVACFLLSFVVRASRNWPRAVATLVLLFDFGASVLGVLGPRVSVVLATFGWSSVTLSAALVILLWMSPVSSSSAAAVTASKRPLTNERA